MTSSTILTLLLLAFFLFHGSNAATITIQNNCLYPVWAAALPGGGRQLNRGQSWNLNAAPGTSGRIWPRTYCLFNQIGLGTCQTGDCNGALVCQSYGRPPYTLARYTINQLGNDDSFNISLVNGFNVPMAFNATSNRCTQGTRCTANIIGQCPGRLRAIGGCNNPYSGSNEDSGYFEMKCPTAITYPGDQSSTYTCPSGTNYRVVFCP